MTVDVKTTATNMVTILEAMTTPSFDEVWLGSPQMMAMGTKTVASVQAAESVNYSDNVCPTHYDQQTLFYIYIECAGTVENATSDMYENTQYVVDAFKATPTFNGGCLGSSVTGVRYGEMATTEAKRLVAVGRVEVLCDYAY